MKLSFIFLGLLFITVIGGASSAYAVTAGCDPVKYNNLKNMSEIRTAYDVGATEEIIPKPDSVLELSCFAKASQVSAEKGGAIFSGDFKGKLNDVIEDATNKMASNFGVNSGGLMNKFGLTTGAASSGWGTNSFSCDNMKDVWNFAQADSINLDVDFMPIKDILKMAMDPPPSGSPSPGNIMEFNLTGSATAAAAVDASLSALPTPIPVMTGDTGGGSANGHLDTCDVMRNLAGGAAIPGCP